MKYEITSEHIKINEGVDWYRIIKNIDIELTDRQHEVLQVLVDNNFSTTTSANVLGITQQGVSNHWQNIKNNYRRQLNEDNYHLFLDNIRYVKIDDIRRLYEDERLTQEQITKETQLPKSVVSRVIKLHQFKNQNTRLYSKRYSQAEIESILADEGYRLLSKFTSVAEPIVFECPQGHIHSINMKEWINQGQRCGKCSASGGWMFTPTLAERYKSQFKNTKATVYIVKLTNHKEKFYKIGITTRKIEYRMQDIPYNYKVIKVIDTNLYKACHIENELHIQHYKYKYTPEKKFGGYSECFSRININI